MITQKRSNTIKPEIYFKWQIIVHAIFGLVIGSLQLHPRTTDLKSLESNLTVYHQK